MSTVEHLAQLLQPFIDGTSGLCRTRHNSLTDGIQDDLPPEVQAIVIAAEDALIVGSTPNWAAMNELKDRTNGHAYVGPGERDSFGWLSAVLYTPHGYFVYG